MAFLSSYFTDLALVVSRFPAASTAFLLLLVVASMACYLDHRSRKLNLPVFGKPGMQFGKEELQEGVEKVGNPLD